MDYSAIKDYGKCVTSLATIFLKSDNMYEGAKAMLEFGDKYFLYSRMMLLLLYEKDSYPKNQKLVTFLYDEYVKSDIVETAFLTKLFNNIDLQIAFIKNNIDNAYTMLCDIQLYLRAFQVTAHPELYTEKQLNEAVENVIMSELEHMKKDGKQIKTAYASLYAKEDIENLIQMYMKALEQDQAEEQNKDQENKCKKQQHRNTAKDQQSQEGKSAGTNKFNIGNNELLLKIYEYLVETNVLFSDTDFQDFLDMAVNANASNILPNKKWKFITSLWYVATCVRGDQKVWAKDICKSIGKKPSDLTKCAEKDPGWLDDLKKLVENNQKNQF